MAITAKLLTIKRKFTPFRGGRAGPPSKGVDAACINKTYNNNNNNNTGKPRVKVIPVHPLDGFEGEIVTPDEGHFLRGGQFLNLTANRPNLGFSTQLQILGEGGFGVVVRGRTYGTGAKDDEETDCAVKISRTHGPSGRSDRGFKRELKVFSKGLKHENLIGILLCKTHNERNFVVLELAEYGSLRDFYRETCGERLKEVPALSILAQVSSGLAYLHDNGIAHFDMKPDNVLVMELHKLRVAITDFGLSADTRDKDGMVVEYQGKCGTHGFMAPEILVGDMYDEKADVWSLGVMTLTLMCGFNPLKGENAEECALLALRGHKDVARLRATCLSHVYPDLWELIKNMLARKDHRFAAMTVHKCATEQLAWRVQEAHPSWTEEEQCPGERSAGCHGFCRRVTVDQLAIPEEVKAEFHTDTERPELVAQDDGTLQVPCAPSASQTASRPEGTTLVVGETAPMITSACVHFSPSLPPIANPPLPLRRCRSPPPPTPAHNKPESQRFSKSRVWSRLKGLKKLFKPR